MVSDYIIRIGSYSYELEANFSMVWGMELSRFGLGVYDMLLRGHIYNMYSLDSMYGDVDIDIRMGVIWRYEFSGVVSYEEYVGVVEGSEGFIMRVLEVVEGQEERVYRNLRERIDRLVREYSNSVVDVSVLGDEPKRIKAIGELLRIKEQLGRGVMRNRGNKVDSIIEGI